MSDLKKTQHYTNDALYILQGLLEYIPKTAILVEPFVGKGDLLKCFPNNTWDVLYDIEENIAVPEITKRDTLRFPPDYKNKWVITNPPYLAKNKAKDKELFMKYKYDDLYKIALSTFIGSEGGIVIVPLNFLTDEYSEKIRKEFLSQYKIDKVNIFKTPVFSSTTYSVCAFAFHKEPNIEQQFECCIPEEKQTFAMRLQGTFGYRYGGEYLERINNIKPIFTRLLADKEPEGFITNLKLYGLDTRSEPIHINFEPQYYYGKSTDRIYATFVCSQKLNEQTQNEIATRFNNRIKAVREEYHNLLFTNYRDYNRKRISFDFAYKLLTQIVKEYENEI